MTQRMPRPVGSPRRSKTNYLGDARQGVVWECEQRPDGTWCVNAITTKQDVLVRKHGRFDTEWAAHMHAMGLATDWCVERDLDTAEAFEQLRHPERPPVRT